MTQIDKTVQRFDDIGIEKCNFHCSKINYVHITKIIISKRALSVIKLLNTLLDANVLIKLYHYVLSFQKKSESKKNLIKIVTSSFLKESGGSVKKCNKILANIRNIMQKGFNNELVCDGKYLNTKLKSYNGKTNTNFHHNKMAEKGSHCVFISILLTDSIFKKDENYYPEVFSEECICIVK